MMLTDAPTYLFQLQSHDRKVAKDLRSIGVGREYRKCQRANILGSVAEAMVLAGDTVMAMEALEEALNVAESIDTEYERSWSLVGPLAEGI